MMFLDCPAYLDRNGALRCGLPAEVTSRYTLDSTDGPIEGAMIRCPAGHYFNGPVELLALDHAHEFPGPAGLGAHGDRDGPRPGLDGRHGSGGFVPRDGPADPERADPERADPEWADPERADPERKVRPPNSAPAYYQGRPAALWISAMSPRRKRPATVSPEAAQGGQVLCSRAVFCSTLSVQR
jgi:hypothetical protein